MLASIFGTAARPLSTPEQVEKVVTDISTFMDEQSFNTAAAVFSSLRPPDQADVMAKLRRIDQVKLLSWLTPKRFGMANIISSNMLSIPAPIAPVIPPSL